MKLELNEQEVELIHNTLVKSLPMIQCEPLVIKIRQQVQVQIAEKEHKDKAVTETEEVANDAA